MRGQCRWCLAGVAVALLACMAVAGVRAQALPERELAEIEENGIVAWPVAPFGSGVVECRALYAEEANGRYRSLMLARDRAGAWHIGAASARWNVDGLGAGTPVTLGWGDAPPRPVAAQRWVRDHFLLPLGERPGAWPSRVTFELQAAAERFADGRLDQLAAAVETCWSRFAHWRIEALSANADAAPYESLPRIGRDQRREMFSAVQPPPASEPEDAYNVRGFLRLGKMSDGLTETPAAGEPDWKGEVGGHAQALRLVPPGAGVSRTVAVRALAARLAADCPARDGWRGHVGRLVGPGDDVDWLIADCVAPDVHVRADALVGEMPGGELWLYHTASDDTGVTTNAAGAMRRLMLRARPGQEGGRQRLVAAHAAEAERRLTPALARLAPRQFVPIPRERWAATGPLSQRLCDYKWGPSTAAITCLRIFPAGEAADALLGRLRLADADDCWPDTPAWSPRDASADRAHAESICTADGKVAATRLYTVVRDGPGGRLFAFVTYGSAASGTLRQVDDTVRRAAGEVLARVP